MQCLGFSQPLMLRSFLRMLLLVRFCFSNGQMKYLFHQVSTLSKKERNMDGAAKAKFNFTAQTPMEVSFLKGDSVVLTRRIDKNWFEGRVSCCLNEMTKTHVIVQLA